ncbi:ADP-ribosylglycohydrolase family protein [Streptomyces sp. NPDC057474]|uniref:ADP-ribosylglycohydrolase family protein n=1 Tax=Streptomyces sp. NPDC057474 TaxID=3346144 RepID=UPI0036908203
MTPLRLTWVQPEDLLGHELQQALQDGREPSAIAARWQSAGGPPAPLRAGASTQRASRYLRLLAEDLLDELADLPSSLAESEPTELSKIKALCRNWPAHPTHPAQPAGSRAAGAMGVPPLERSREWERVGADGTLSAPVGATSGGLGAGPPASGRGGLREETPPTPAAHLPRLEAAWLGRAVGCLLGKPVEKLSLTAIRQLARSTGNWPLTTWFTARGVPPELLAAHPWNRRSAPTSLAENIDGMPEDDDLNYPLLNLLLLARHGRHFTTTDVATLWLDELPAGRTFTAERIAYRNLLTGIDPPHTARHRNPFREWIGALIRADVHGWTNPGDPAAAAEQAHRDATLTHTTNGVYAAIYIAATIAQAASVGSTGTHDIHHCVRTGLQVVPPDSRLAKAINHALRLTAETRDFDTIVDELHTAYADHHWVHAIPNTALITAALTHADGDFTASICRAVSGGWDTDSNGATAGSIAGLLTGSPDALPDRWTAPLKNRLATSIADFNGIGFDALAHLTLRETPHP